MFSCNKNGRSFLLYDSIEPIFYKKRQKHLTNVHFSYTKTCKIFLYNKLLLFLLLSFLQTTKQKFLLWIH
jgi:hypothetical protein